MIALTSLTDAGINTTIIHRADNQGAPEYAKLIRWDHRYLYIQVHGNVQITRVRPIEVSKVTA